MFDFITKKVVKQALLSNGVDVIMILNLLNEWLDRILKAE